jgi:hypothetical protein
LKLDLENFPCALSQFKGLSGISRFLPSTVTQFAILAAIGRRTQSISEGCSARWDGYLGKAHSGLEIALGWHEKSGLTVDEGAVRFELATQRI